MRHGICVAKMLDNVGLRYPHRASGAKAPRTLRPLPLLRFAVSATGGAHLCSIQYYPVSYTHLDVYKRQHLNCIIRLDLEAMGQKTLYVKDVFLVIIRCVAVEGMLGEIIFCLLYTSLDLMFR